jgi:polyphosphate kinase
LTQEASSVKHLICANSKPTQLEHLLVALLGLRLDALVDYETAGPRGGLHNPKRNAVEDRGMIAPSSTKPQAGVRVELIVRGALRLRGQLSRKTSARRGPWTASWTAGVRFAHGGEEKVYVSSVD